MTNTIHFDGEQGSNHVREVLNAHEPCAQRTFTPTQAVLSRSAGSFHYTPEGRKLYDYSSGVLVSNLGHNPRSWLKRLWAYMGWDAFVTSNEADEADEYVPAVTLTAYNAMTELESQGVERLLASLHATPFGERLQSVLWAASGSEAVQKSLWACLHRDRARDLIVATRYGFHGKKGLAGAVTGSEADADRDPRVLFVGFPMEECDDVSKYGEPLDLTPYEAELDALWKEYGERLNCLITEPYLGGGGSYHPPLEYHALLRRWCDAHDIVLIFDEVQSNFGRTGCMYAFEKYEVEPDIICLGKGMGNGVPVNAAVGRSDIFASLSYGEGSDTWSAHPLGCAAMLATLDEFEERGVLEHAASLSTIFFAGLERLKDTGAIAKVRGEGLVFGIEAAPIGTASARDVGLAIVEEAYQGRDGVGIHFLGPLAGKVLRVSPPMTMTAEQATASLDLLHHFCRTVSEKFGAEALAATAD